MTRGRYAAADGSFARSAGMQTVRGAVLLGVAVLIGVILLSTAPHESVALVSAKPTTTTTTHKPATIPPAGGPTTTTALRQPSTVTVLVANGTTVTGAAGRVNAQLIQAGYNSVGTATGTRQDATTTTVFFVPGFQPEAVALASALSLPAAAAKPMASPPPVANTRGADLLVVVGTDVAAQIGSGSPTPAPTQPSQPPAPTSHPTTTAHTTTTVHTAATNATTTTVKH